MFSWIFDGLRGVVGVGGVVVVGVGVGVVVGVVVVAVVVVVCVSRGVLRLFVMVSRGAAKRSRCPMPG